RRQALVRRSRGRVVGCGARRPAPNRGRGIDRASCSEAGMKALALFLATLLAAIAASAAQRPERLVVITDDQYPPYLFRGEDGDLQGHTKDKWEAWSRATGIPVEIVGARWAEAQETARNGGADVIDLLTYTPSRARDFELSESRGQIEARLFF